jgi:hypothetical protein
VSSPYRKAKARYGHWRYKREMARPAPATQVAQPARIAVAPDRKRLWGGRDTPPIEVHVSLRKPLRRLMYRYRRWRYQREMATPAPAPRRSHGTWYSRAWRRVRHPIVHVRGWRQTRVESQPVLAPRTEAELRGGPIRRTLRQAEFRVSHARHNFTNWPITAQVVSCLVMAAVLVGVFFEGKSLIRHRHSPVASQAAFFRSLGANAGGGTKVLVVGDVTTAQLGGGGNYLDNGINGAAYTDWGCGIMGGATVFGKPTPIPTVCNDWPAQYTSISEAFRPQVVVLMTGNNEQEPHEENGSLLKPGEAAYERYIDSRIDVARAAAAQKGVRFAVATPPTCSYTSTGFPIYARVWLGQVYHRYVFAHPGTVFIPIDQTVCPKGRFAKDGAGHDLINANGLTNAGANQAWATIAAATHPSQH